MSLYFTHPKLGRAPVSPIIGAIVLVLLLAACGGPAATATSAPSDAAVNGFNGSNSSLDVSRPEIPAAVNHPISSTAAPVLAEELDADAVVAAQEQVMIRLYQDLLPSMVHIQVSQRLQAGEDFPSFPWFPDRPQDDFPQDFFQQGEGSGFVWDKEGHVITNNHVIEGAERVTVVFADREELEAEVIGTDPDSDLAVLELQTTKDDLRPVALGDSDALQVGQMAIAIGNPFGQQFTMTAGIVSALGRTISSTNSPFSIPEVIQTDAPINPGNSGGPLLDRYGRVIGVNTQIISRSGSSSGIGFSVPINTAKRVIPALIKDGHYAYSYLGITGSDLPPDTAERMGLPRSTGGALIISVSADGPAEQAGLEGSGSSFTLEGTELPLGGDVVVGINNTPIRFMDDLVAYLVSETRPGDEVQLEVVRDGGGRITLDVTLGERPGADG